jgi:peptide/nickel transport system permease protein
MAKGTGDKAASKTKDGHPGLAGKAAEKSVVRPVDSYRALVWRQFRQNRGASLGLVMILLLVIVAVVGPSLAPYDPVDMNLMQALQRPSSLHWLGTDELGRDILSRLLAGSRVTLLITSGAVFFGTLVGSIIGVVSGFYIGWVDDVLMRLMDILLSLPGFILAIAVVALLGPGTVNVVIAVAVSSVPVFGRLSRGSTLSAREQDYVMAARSMGASSPRIVVQHIFPNVVAPILVQSSLNLATAVLTAAGLSFLGLGPQPPAPEWGGMLSTARGYIISSAWHLSLAPGLAILLAAMSFNLVGDGLRDAMDPRLKKR